ncbi:class 1 fructose-bisphosphatase, partial [Oligoflexia bacterium]|nr:class 1 fructose-bisphosphatase [Oligoflexia bacterium]
IALGVKVISRLVASAGIAGLHGYTGKTNIQGESVAKLDEESDQILIEVLGANNQFGSLVSEEHDTCISTEQSGIQSKYVVAFDPLDGSSNVGSNIPVGTIFTIFQKKDMGSLADTNDFLQKGRDIVAAGYAIYGAMTTFVYCCGDGVHGFTLDPTIGEFLITDENIRMPEQGNIYSVNEGYWSMWTTDVQDYVRSLKRTTNPTGKSYTARYVGSLVADFDRNLKKGGVFLNPATTERPQGKLRLLYECMPMAYIVEHAGGRATNGEKDVLDILPEDIHERCPFFMGGKKEFEWFEEVTGKKR